MIEGHHLNFAYGAQHVLRDVSFRVAAGQLTGILGANGSGKTTLLRLAMGLLRPSSGIIRVAGQTPTDGDRRAFARLVAAVHGGRRGHCRAPWYSRRNNSSRDAGLTVRSSSPRLVS